MAKYNSDNLSSNKKMSTKAKWGISLLVISFCLFILSVTNFIVPIHNFILGCFGLAVYPILLILMAVSVLLLLKKQYDIPKIYLISAIIAFCLFVCFFQLVLTNLNVSFADYIKNCYYSHNTVGGVLMGLLCYALYLGLGKVGTIVLFVIVLVLCTAFIIDHILKVREGKDISERVVSYPNKREKQEKKVLIAESKEKVPENTQKALLQQKIKEHSFKEETLEKQDTNKENGVTLKAYVENKNKKEEAKRALFQKSSYGAESQDSNDEIAIKIFGQDFVNSIKNSKTEQKPQPDKKYTLNELYETKKEQKSSEEFSFVNTTSNGKPSRFIHTDEKPFISNIDIEEEEEEKEIQKEDNSLVNLNEFEETKQNNEVEEKLIEEEDFDEENPFVSSVKEDVSKDQEKEEDFNNIDDIDLSSVSDIIAPKEEVLDFEKQNEVVQKEEKTEQKIEEKPKEEPKKKPKNIPYIKPPIDLLTTKSSAIESDPEAYQAKAHVLEQTLESFRIPAKVMGITKGPAVTRYELQMPVGIPVKKITQHADDITMMMESRAGVRIETPIPGRSLVGIEVPNDKVATIGLKDILDTDSFKNAKGHLTFVLGKDIGGECKICNLETMPHLLVAGTTGSGKSVCLNVLLISLLYKLGPEDLKLILVDPKRVEFVTYNYLPHMLVPKAINDPQQALNALDWAIKEMSRRFDMFSERRVRNFKEYNSSSDVVNGLDEKLPYIVIVIDELADLMMVAGRELEEKIQRLTQLARAAGIHLILATQRPSVDVITGVIKSNLPSRIAFAVTDFASSKTILDKGGADKLLGRGDMLYAPQDLPEPVRIQCPFVDGKEVYDIVQFIKEHNEAYFDDSISDYIQKGENGGNTQSTTNSTSSGNNGGGWDPLLPQALLDFIQAGGGSASMIQRKHSIGFVRAGRIVDQMENAGFIAPRDPAKQTRTVLISLEKYNEIFGEDE